MPCVLSCSAPVQQPDGSLVWTGYMRRAQERRTDVEPGAAGQKTQVQAPSA
jgi:hypothetical protein